MRGGFIFESLKVLMLESTIRARSSGRFVSASKRSIFWGTPSSTSVKASTVRSGMGRPLGSLTLARMFTRLVSTRIGTDFWRSWARRGAVGAAEARIAMIVAANLRLGTAIPLQAGAAKEIFVINFTGG